MAKADFAVTGARSAMGRLPRAETENAMNWTSWLPLRALSGWTAKDLDGDLAAGIPLAAIEVMPPWRASSRPPLSGLVDPENRFAVGFRPT
ncbi:hypothetical protein [Mesorhizobium captivum]|uniref:hypothetical protein n=1 Tax=Mesorhizobium captivum TaxID=3072319 RepID=UPI002A24252D|nr:hypothetical protein [Mesorhizobium sp. VK22E]MDX8504387.1 hypothetical protein [Mesorhizobium sp. VK22E]